MPRKPSPQRNTKEQILGFRRSMRNLAHHLARQQGMYAGEAAAPAIEETIEDVPDRAKRHTCVKAPASWQKPGDCAECAYELRVRQRLSELLGPPESAKEVSPSDAELSPNRHSGPAR